MRLPLALLCAAMLAGCSAAGGSLVPLRAVGKASGDAEGPQVFLAGVPMNALVRVHGNVSYTVQPMPPYVTLDGDYTIVVEPMPGMEEEAQRAVTTGAMLIRRKGVASNLNAPGSIEAFKAMRARLYTPPPPPPPTPAPIKASESGKFCDPDDPDSPCHLTASK